jgi:hypothetical protein
MLTKVCHYISSLRKASKQSKSPSENKNDSINGISIGPDVTYDQYFELAQLAATPKPFNPLNLRPGNPSPTDPFQLGSLDVIEQVKLDRNGASGLKPNDFLIVARIALRSGNPLVSDTLSGRIDDSNYTSDEKTFLFAELEHEGSDEDEEDQYYSFNHPITNLDDLTPESRSDKDSDKPSPVPNIQRNGLRLEDLGKIEEI